MLIRTVADDMVNIFLSKFFSEKIKFDISSEFWQTIHIKVLCVIFSGKKMKQTCSKRHSTEQMSHMKFQALFSLKNAKKKKQQIKKLTTMPPTPPSKKKKKKYNQNILCSCD